MIGIILYKCKYIIYTIYIIKWYINIYYDITYNNVYDYLWHWYRTMTYYICILNYDMYYTEYGNIYDIIVFIT